jgi:hypothetical protein
MANIKREGNLIELDGRVRIEHGPTLVKATATKELLDNSVTAEHYQPGAFDALAKPIVLGEEMHYLDLVGRAQGTEGSTSWYVYQLEDLTEAELKKAGHRQGEGGTRGPRHLAREGS